MVSLHLDVAVSERRRLGVQLGDSAADLQKYVQDLRLRYPHAAAVHTRPQSMVSVSSVWFIRQQSRLTKLYLNETSIISRSVPLCNHTSKSVLC